MSFFDEIKYRSLAGRVIKYSVIVFGGEAVYVEGITRVVSVSSDKIELNAGKTLLTVEGENMTVEELEKETVIIKGRIKSYRGD